MKIAVIGASGWLGGTIAREAITRGHQVTAIGRNVTKLRAIEGATVVTADIADPASIEQAIAGHDVVVAAVTDRGTPDRSIIPKVARTLLQVLPEAGVKRLVVVGGGGSLEVKLGVRVVDEADFPEAYKAEALAQAEALDIYRGYQGEVGWAYLSPPPHHLVPGEKQGNYRVQAGDRPVLDQNGDSRITAGDFASALVDEIERPRFTRQRFTAAY